MHQEGGFTNEIANIFVRELGCIQCEQKQSGWMIALIRKSQNQFSWMTRICNGRTVCQESSDPGILLTTDNHPFGTDTGDTIVILETPAELYHQSRIGVARD
jgi:hypothetical protein